MHAMYSFFRPTISLQILCKNIKILICSCKSDLLLMDEFFWNLHRILIVSAISIYHRKLRRLQWTCSFSSHALWCILSNAQHVQLSKTYPMMIVRSTCTRGKHLPVLIIVHVTSCVMKTFSNSLSVWTHLRMQCHCLLNSWRSHFPLSLKII